MGNENEEEQMQEKSHNSMRLDYRVISIKSEKRELECIIKSSGKQEAFSA